MLSEENIIAVRDEEGEIFKEKMDIDGKPGDGWLEGESQTGMNYCIKIRIPVNLLFQNSQRRPALIAAILFVAGRSRTRRWRLPR